MFGKEGTKRKAVAYYRHSAEDKQENSVEIQQDQAREFATKHNVEIIHEEADKGKSGLVAKRPAFERLFKDWIYNSDAPDFDYVFVLDETRWGRWQDTDEAAYWTFICKQHGKQVIYITHGFPEGEHKLIAGLSTAINRHMAAEYSRQLGRKVWHGDIKVIQQGFSAGGAAPYGYVRVLFDEQHQRIGVLKRGEHKVISNQRVTFEPSGDGTKEVVSRIFKLFVYEWNSPAEIAGKLNDDGILSATGRQWNSGMIIRILSNETYTGTLIWNKTSSQLKQKTQNNNRDAWVICPGAFEGIISQESFKAAQERLYWTIPSRWKRGLRRINQTERSLKTYISGLLKDIEHDRRYEIMRRLPVALGLTYYDEGEVRRCFVINEDMRKHNEILAVSVSMFDKNKVDATFVLPTKDFGIGGYLIVDDADKTRIGTENAEDKVLQLCETIGV